MRPDNLYGRIGDDGSGIGNIQNDNPSNTGGGSGSGGSTTGNASPSSSSAISPNGHYEYPNIPTASHLLSLLQNKIKLNDWEFYQAYKQGVYVFPKNTHYKPIDSYYYDVTYYKDRKDTLYGTDSFIRWIFPNYTKFNGYIENGKRNDDNTWTALGRTNEALIAKAQGDNNFTIDKEGETFDYLGNKVGTYTIDNSKYPPVVIIPTSTTSTTTGGGIDINDLHNQGWVETINSKNISGWAAKGKTPSAVDIYIDDVKYTVTPTLERPDVASTLNTKNKNFGWSFDIPQTSVNTSTGKHQVTVYYSNSQMLLSSNLSPFYVVAKIDVPPPTSGSGTPTSGSGTPTSGSGTPTSGSGTPTSGSGTPKSDKPKDKPKPPIQDAPQKKLLKPILIGLGVVILVLVTYKLLKKNDE